MSPKGMRTVKKTVGILVLPLLLVGAACFSSRAQQSSSKQIPVGTILPVRLNQSLSFKNTKAGQAISARIMQDVPLPDGTRLRAGSTVAGHILEVTSATKNGATIFLQFDKVISGSETIPVRTNLRAIASSLEVNFAQVPQYGMGEGEVWNWMNTTQIGGDIVYGVDGPVTSGSDSSHVVGKSVNNGVLVEVSAKQGTTCRGAVSGNNQPQALWVFSSDACGPYGLSDLQILHAGRTDPLGVIVLASQKSDLKIYGGAGMLLRVQ